MAQVENTGPVKVVGNNVQRTQLKFYSLVVQASDVAQLAGNSGSGADVDAVEQVFGIPVVIFQTRENTVNK